MKQTGTHACINDYTGFPALLVILLIILLILTGLLAGLKLLGVITLGWSALAMVIWLPLAILGVVLAPLTLFTGVVLLIQRLHSKQDDS